MWALNYTLKTSPGSSFWVCSDWSPTVLQVLNDLNLTFLYQSALCVCCKIWREEVWVFLCALCVGTSVGRLAIMTSARRSQFRWSSPRSWPISRECSIRSPLQMTPSSRKWAAAKCSRCYGFLPGGGSFGLHLWTFVFLLFSLLQLCKECPDCRVFATDAILATLMTCSRSIYSWDIVIEVNCQCSSLVNSCAAWAQAVCVHVCVKYLFFCGGY